jgi:NADH dehydrogenase [ubiquinone] 1 alpha subcomplex assembly factor 7
MCASLQILNVTGSNILVLFRPGFWFVLSSGPTIASSLHLAKRMKWASLEEKAKIEHVEVCPSALKRTAEIARRIGEDGGGALVVDYGDKFMVSDSLQVSATSIR